MNKILMTFLTIVLLGGLVAVPVLAATGDEETPELYFNPAESDASLGNVEDVNLGNTAPLTMASRITNGVLGFLGIIFLGLTLYAGFMWMTAQGNEEEITKAKKILKSAIIGLIIVLASFGIASFVYEYVARGTIVQ